MRGFSFVSIVKNRIIDKIHIISWLYKVLFMFSIYHLVISPTNIGAFKLKLPRVAQSGAPLRDNFH